MKNYLTLLILAFSFSGGAAFADHKHAVVHVKGMVCAFCAQGLTKKFTGQVGVEKIDVKLDKKVVNLSLKHGEEITDEKIKELITDAGFNVEKIDRD